MGTGVAQITSCPSAMVTPDIWEVIEFARDARRGAWPVSGGTLEQSQSFLLAARQIWAEEAVHKAPLVAKGIHLE
jgi:hypothetical protein